MTSEVLILNKHAVVLAADSAVTTSPARDGEHPRYSKTASKLFELSDNGNVAAMIFGGASIDLVPWELLIKLFRKSISGASLPTFEQYVDQLVTFVKANTFVFPADILDELTAARFKLALKHVLALALDADKNIFENTVPVPARQTAWASVVPTLEALITKNGLHKSLSPAAFSAELTKAPNKVADVAKQLAAEAELAGVDAAQLTDLATKALYYLPTDFLSSTGLVVAGYGEQDIFPGFKSIEIFGHVNNELVVADDKELRVTHTRPAWIQALAQTSMIDVFTDGFGTSLQRIIRKCNLSSMQEIFDELEKTGISVPEATARKIITDSHKEFMKSWQRQNYHQNWFPLTDVLSGLSVQEMAHLAETLLTLESLKERVTSSSESVGGPIDIAAITKAEGLVWLKRKHHFEPSLNMRYVTRLQRTLHP